MDKENVGYINNGIFCNEEWNNIIGRKSGLETIMCEISQRQEVRCLMVSPILEAEILN